MSGGRRRFLSVFLFCLLTSFAYAEEWRVGTTRTAILEVKGTESYLAELKFRAELDIPHGGRIDAERAFSNEGALRDQDYPWLVRTAAVAELIRYRLFLKSLLEAYGVTAIDARLPQALNDLYPAEAFPEFDAHAEALADRTPDPDAPVLRRRFSWLILSHALRLDDADRWIHRNPALLSNRAKLAAQAPRLLEVRFRSKTLEWQTALYDRIRESLLGDPTLLGENLRDLLRATEIRWGNSRDATELPATIDRLLNPLIRDALLASAAANYEAIELLTRARDESDVDPLLACESLHQLISDQYGPASAAFLSARGIWKLRSENRVRAEKARLIWASGASAGLLLISGVAPFVTVNLAPARLTSFAATFISGMAAWHHYWQAYAQWSLERSTFAGSDLLVTSAEYDSARRRFGHETTSALATGIFFVPGLISWGRIQGLLRSGPAGWSAVLRDLDSSLAASRAGAFLSLRARLARWSIGRLERSIASAASRGLLPAAELTQGLGRAAVFFDGMRYSWAGSGNRPYAPTPGNLAVTLIGTNLVIKWATEMMLRNGDMWEDEKLFGLNRPKTGVLINLTIGSVVLGTMAFATGIKSPYLRAIPASLVTGGATAISQGLYTGSLDFKRIGFEMGYNVIATLIFIPPQIRAAEFLRSLGRGPGTAHLLNRMSWSATGLTVSRLHSTLVLRWFEQHRQERDRYGNVYSNSSLDGRYRSARNHYSRSTRKP